MPKESKSKVNDEEMLEQFLYPSVRKYFSEELDCESVGSTNGSSISLSIFGGKIIPDVYGIKNPKGSNFEIFMAEGKLDFAGRNFDICKGQAISLQRFADYVYLFFPKQSWDRLQKGEREDILLECKNLKLGLLIIDGENCQQLASATQNENLLNETRKSSARNLITNYFPDFIGPKENATFFERFTELALNMAGECYSILENKCKSVFKEIVGVKQASIQVYYDRDDGYLQFCISRDFSSWSIWITTNPFGHSGVGITDPILVLEQHLYEKYLKKGISEKLVDYLFECSKEGSKIELYTDEEQIILDRSEEVVTYINRLAKNLEKISVYKAIKLVGRKREIIRREAKSALKKMYEFAISARRR